MKICYRIFMARSFWQCSNDHNFHSLGGCGSGFNCSKWLQRRCRITLHQGLEVQPGTACENLLPAMVKSIKIQQIWHFERPNNQWQRHALWGLATATWLQKTEWRKRGSCEVMFPSVLPGPFSNSMYFVWNSLMVFHCLCLQEVQCFHSSETIASAFICSGPFILQTLSGPNLADLSDVTQPMHLKHWFAMQTKPELASLLI